MKESTTKNTINNKEDAVHVREKSAQDDFKSNVESKKIVPIESSLTTECRDTHTDSADVNGSHLGLEACTDINGVNFEMDNGNGETPSVVDVRLHDNGGDKGNQEDEEGAYNGGCCGRLREKQSKVTTKAVGTFELFRFTRKLDLLLIGVGTLGSIAAGCAFPVNLFIYGKVINVILESAFNATETVVNGSTSAYESLFEETKVLTVYFCFVGVGAFISNFISISCWCLTAERQVRLIRSKYFRAIMKQDIGWFDTHESGELNSRFSQDMHNIIEGMGDKVAVFLQWISTWMVGYLVALILNWKLALVAMVFSPFLVCAGTVTGRIVRNYAGKESRAYAKAGAIAEEVFRAIRTVHAFQGQEKEGNRYEANLIAAKAISTKKGLFLGISLGFVWATILSTFSLTLWYGIRLVQTENLSPGNIFPVFLGVMIGSSSLGNAFPSLETFANARGAAAKVFEIIDTVPDIDVSSNQGEKPSHVEGNMEFRNVHFNYPSRPDIKILSGFSMKVLRGQVVALVGPSGCGKSTAIQLLQRFYDPQRGQV